MFYIPRARVHPGPRYTLFVCGASGYLSFTRRINILAIAAADITTAWMFVNG
jgi:hypothetical protein